MVAVARRLSAGRMVAGLDQLAERRTTTGLQLARWCPHQVAFLKCDAREKLLRTGNQAGKTWAGCAEVIHRCLGNHPYLRTTPPPVECWIVCASWSQSVAIQEKFWERVPRDQLVPGTVFTPERGFRGKNPVVRFKNGSIVRFKTTKQGGLNLASATIDFVLIDELTTSRIYTELRKRVMRRGGSIALTITPINADSGWLEARVQRGQVVDLHFRWGPHLFVPVGEAQPLTTRNGEPMDLQWCNRELDATAEEERDVTCHGEWPVGDVEREMRGFRDGHLFEKGERLPRFEMYMLGFDHGEKAGREIGLLVAWTRERGGELWVLGEYASTGASSLADDARGVQTMLEGWGLALRDIDFAVGDVNSAGATARGVTVNEVLTEEFAALAGGTRPFAIRTAQKGAGSIDDRVTLLNSAFASSRIRVCRACPRLVESLRKWRGQNTRLKDPIDALGYVYQEVLPLRGRVAAKVRIDR